MNRQVRWLHEQMPTWVTQGAISSAQAAAIRRLYPEPKAALPWGMLFFSGIGAVVVGLDARGTSADQFRPRSRCSIWRSLR